VWPQDDCNNKLIGALIGRGFWVTGEPPLGWERVHQSALTAGLELGAASAKTTVDPRGTTASA